MRAVANIELIVMVKQYGGNPKRSFNFYLNGFRKEILSHVNFGFKTKTQTCKLTFIIKKKYPNIKLKEFTISYRLQKMTTNLEVTLYIYIEFKEILKHLW